MTRAELGYLLLCCDLGQDVKPLTLFQLKQLRLRLQAAPRPDDSDRELCAQDVQHLGYSAEQARHIVSLLQREEALETYLRIAKERRIFPICINSPTFPPLLKQRLGHNCPPVLFLRGDESLLKSECVALVGSRELESSGREFARKVGELAAKEQLVLVSGHASGADEAAENACLQSGGCVISVVADELFNHAPERERRLYICEDGWQLPFSSYRALKRNRIIHALAALAFIAQCEYKTGGTWKGTYENLRHGYCSVFVHADNSEGATGLLRLGAQELSTQELCSIRALLTKEDGFL